MVDELTNNEVLELEIHYLIEFRIDVSVSLKLSRIDFKHQTI